MDATENVRAYFSPLGRMRMLGGTPALDFANTLHWRDGALAEFTPDYREFVAWCVPARLLSVREAKKLLALAKRQPAQAVEMHIEIFRLRVALKRWLTASASNQNGKRNSALRVLQGTINEAAGNSKLQDLTNPEDGVATLGLRLPLLRCTAAVLLLVMFPPPGDIRRCEADHCGGFFLNQSRAKPRRWCSMDGCGNRAKATRFRLARRAGD